MNNDLHYGQVNSSIDINIPYGSCLLPSNVRNRQGAPGPDIFGNGVDYTECIPQVIQPPSVIGPQNTTKVNTMDQYLFSSPEYPRGTSQFTTIEYSNTDLQSVRPPEYVSNRYIELAGQSLHARPDLLLKLFFSDDNINHLRNTVVQKVKEITADSGVAGTPDGVTIKTPNIDDFFYYMVNIYQTYKTHNGSICFVNLKQPTDVKSELIKLNSTVLQEYVSKMVSQINMYIYYYIDASQLPEQLSLPRYNSMKGSKVLEYNTAFTSGNSWGIASYNEVGNVI
jgi:hypothetical protein